MRPDKKFKILPPRHMHYSIIPSIKVNLHQEVNAVENALRGNYYYRGPSRLFADPFRVRLTMYGDGRGREHRKSYETEYAHCKTFCMCIDKNRSWSRTKMHSIE